MITTKTYLIVALGTTPSTAHIYDLSSSTFKKSNVTLSTYDTSMYLMTIESDKDVWA
jgi:hypothetical protein